MSAKKGPRPKRMTEEEQIEQARRNSAAIRGDSEARARRSKVNVAKVIEQLEAELDLMVEETANNPWHGLIRARTEGRSSALAWAIELLTGVSSTVVLEESEVRLADKHGRTENAEVMVYTDEGFVWVKPWCDCERKGAFTRTEQGVWVQSCCGRRTKHAWLRSGDSLGRTLPEEARLPELDED